MAGAADSFQSYENPEKDNYNWDSKIHPPISWHSYAACMNGRFICASPKNKFGDHIKWADCILFTVNYNPKIALDVVLAAKKLGKKVIGAYHENFDFFQYTAKNLQWVNDFKNFANACDAFLLYPHKSMCETMFRGIGITTELIYIMQPYHTDMRKDFLFHPGLILFFYHQN